MPNYAALKSELTTDPKALGYAALIAKGADTDLAMLLNATTGNGAGTVTLSSISGDAFRKLVFPATMGLPAAGSTVQAKWQPTLQWLVDAQSVVVDAEFNGAMTALIADVGAFTGAGGVPAFNQARISQFTTRTGNRAEAIGFFDLIGDSPQQVTHQDVAQALRG